jgi:hypothetical protein
MTGGHVNTETGHSADDTKSPFEDSPRPSRKWMLTLVALTAVFILLAVYDLVFIGFRSGGGRSATAPVAASPAAAHAKTSASARPQAAPAKEPPSSADRQQTIAAATAFGPSGTTDGDNAGTVSRVLGGGTEPWRSAWYATADFGNLQSGTGILLDMGKSVMVSRVQVVLGAEQGADLQVRVGNDPSLARLPMVASASAVSNTVQMPSVSAVSGRYVLIWFTRLPFSSLGRYEVSVFSVTVDGTTRS